MKSTCMFAAFLFLYLGLGCTPSPPLQEKQQEDLIEAERDFDPLAQDQDRPIVIAELEEGSEQVRMLQKDQKAPGTQEIPIGPDDAGMIKGYRVQIFLSDNLREAARIMAEARDDWLVSPLSDRNDQSGGAELRGFVDVSLAEEGLPPCTDTELMALGEGLSFEDKKMAGEALETLMGAYR